MKTPKKETPKPSYVCGKYGKRNRCAEIAEELQPEMDKLFTAAPAHTPGPWGIHTEKDLEDQVTIRELNNPNHGRILAVVDDLDDQDKANAALIAAAPDLLAALKELCFGTPDRRAYEQAEAIIAAAEDRK